MRAALVITWRGVLPGREGAFMRYSERTDEFWGKLAADGRVSAPQFYVGLGGKGLWMVTGEFEDLAGILASEEGMRLFAETRLYLHEFDVDLMLTERDADRFAAAWAQASAALAA